jgi:hypothetical protein
MSTTAIPAPPYDAELEAALEVLHESFSPALYPRDIPMLRSAKLNPDAEELTSGRPIEYTENRSRDRRARVLLHPRRRLDLR